MTNFPQTKAIPSNLITDPTNFTTPASPGIEMNALFISVVASIPVLSLVLVFLLLFVCFQRKDFNKKLSSFKETSNNPLMHHTVKPTHVCKAHSSSERWWFLDCFTPLFRCLKKHLEPSFEPDHLSNSGTVASPNLLWAPMHSNNSSHGQKEVQSMQTMHVSTKL